MAFAGAVGFGGVLAEQHMRWCDVCGAAGALKLLNRKDVVEGRGVGDSGGEGGRRKSQKIRKEGKLTL